MPLVSIIIPIFNVAPYLPRCLDSIINQTLKDIEIICINDCSLDNSMNILREYAIKDSRIKLIDLEQGYKHYKGNQGVSIARNICIQEATGEYIGFVDGDDWIDRDFYERLYEKAVESGADITKSGVRISKDDNVKYINVDNFNGYYTKLLNEVEYDKFMLHNVIWNAIYRHDFIKKYKLDFATELAVAGAEDEFFNIKAGYYCNKIELVRNAIYRHYRREGSLYSNYLNTDKVKCRILLSQYLSDFLNSNDYPRTSYIKRILLTSYTLSNYFEKTDTRENRMLIVQQILKLYKEVKKSYKRDFIMDVKAKDDRLYKYLESDDEEGLYNLLLKKSKKKTTIIKMFGFLPFLTIKRGKVLLFNRIMLLEIA